MKKILAVFDGLKFSDSTLKYAVKMGIQHNAMITGVFLEDMTYSSRGIYQLYSEKEYALDSVKHLVAEDRHERDAAVDRFENACKDAGIAYMVHRDKQLAVRDLLKESRYADLLLIDASESMTRYTEESPTHFVREILAGTRCPVLLLPRHFTDIRRVYWLHDGSPVSIYAFKMFNYILPVLSELPLDVLSAKMPGEEGIEADKLLIKELVSLHAPHAGFISLTGQPDLEIPLFLRKQDKESLLILGAYQRNALSMLFKASMADLLVKEHQWPLFIAHNK
ncbi:universal stress protein [Chitinophaga sancti]|uniref:universal stress protein n=1 Tax=Chitinophaga sancti TaxID=1004 RepID=UPI002A74B026|nr:universal stress protein [Chitinophaga sancti]WPQ60459.1 universal stress protein [Chitinophaga sancti]